MKILEIDNRTYDEWYNDHGKLISQERKPTHNLIVELTQKEYELISFYLELERRNGIKTQLELPKYKELNK